MQRSVEKLFKQDGTPVSVRFGLDLKHVILDIEDKDQELKDIWALHVKADTSGVYEPTINHGISCHCCARIIRIESYTHPFDFEVKTGPKKPGRPRTRRVP
jgi:hypothetical protein